jgi:hypothetical protein
MEKVCFQDFAPIITNQAKKIEARAVASMFAAAFPVKKLTLPNGRVSANGH